jgi:capsular exopolysaccharide synthesis family protein
MRRYWLLALAVLVIVMLNGAAASFLPAKSYEATATVAADLNPAIGGNLVQAAAFEIPGIVETVGSSPFRATVVTKVDPAYAQAGVGLSAVSEPGTGIIRLTGTGGNPQAVAAWATAAANTLVEQENVLSPAPVDPATTTIPGTPPPPGISTSPVVLRLLDPAGVPSKPVSPRPTILMVGTFMLGSILAVVAAVVAYRFNRALDVVEDIRRRLGVPVIGQIPTIRQLKRGNRSFAEVFSQDSPDLVEAFQGLRTSIELLSRDGNLGSVAVSSWGAGEGKSSVCAGLAMAFSSSGHRVVAIDADLRNPNLHHRLGESFGEGVADAGRVPVENLVWPTRFPNLSLMSAGIPDRHPADVLAVTLPRVVGSLLADDRLLLIDAPPIHGVAETPMILSLAGHVVLVVDGTSQKLPQLEQSVRRLQGSGVTIVGVVLNRMRHRRQAPQYRAYVPGATNRPPTNGHRTTRRSRGTPGSRPAPLAPKPGVGPR